MFLYHIDFAGKCRCQAENYDIAEAKFNSWAWDIEENDEVPESDAFEFECADEVDDSIYQITFYGSCRAKANCIEEAIKHFRHWAKNFKTAYGISDIVIDINLIEKVDYGEEK